MDAQYKVTSPLQHYLENLHAKYHSLDDGKVADYIPELSHADPEWFGIALVTVDGHVYQVGDTHKAFTIQSISKAITYGLALTDNGIDYVTQKVGVEPSGDAFNSISLDPVTGQPCNPMINAGAISTTGMVKGRDGMHKMQRILDTMERYVGHAISINEPVYRSESETGHRNRAIAHLLRNFNNLEGNPDEVLELYFKQCSMNVNCRDLAVLAACLANNGVNPITGMVALEKRYVDKVLSVMGSCGMYDYSGNWLYRVGMPAKSGVGGGIIAVLPGQFGLAVFSPRLDELGNSVRGIRVCEELSAAFRLHLFDTPSSTATSVLRVGYSAAQISSCKSRHETERKLLAEHGDRIRGFELQGDLMFGSTESVIRNIMEQTVSCDYFIVELKRVVAINEASARLWLEAIQNLRDMGKYLFFTCADSKYSFVRYLKNHANKIACDELFRFTDRDHAFEWCEDHLLKELAPVHNENIHVGFGEQAICQGLSDTEINALQGACKKVAFSPGDLAFKRGDKADSMYFIDQGELEVIIHIDNKREKRLTTLSAGMCFGELAMLNQNTRAAEVRAKTNALCHELKFTAIKPEVRTKMLVNLAGMLATKVEQDAREISAMY